MNVRICSGYPTLAEAVAVALREAGHAIEVVAEPRMDCVLQYRRDLPLSEVTQLVDRLKPLLPAVQPKPSVRGADAELSLGDARPLAHWEIKLFTDSEPLAERLRAQFSALGFRDDGGGLDEIESSTLKYGGASSFARQVVRFLLAKEGIRATESRDWTDADDDLWVHARDESLVGRPIRERYPVEIHGDDYERMFALEGALRAAGFTEVHQRSLEQPGTFLVDVGPLGRDEAAADALHAAVSAFVAAEGVDPARYPVVRQADRRGHARIEVPLAAWRSEGMPPYAGPFPERWDVVVRTDEPSAGATVADALRGLGYRARVEALPPSALGFAVRLGAARAFPEVFDTVRGVLEAALADRPLAAGHALSVLDAADEASPQILIDWPAGVAARTAFRELLVASAAGFELTLKTPDPEGVDGLLAALKGLPWREVSVEAETDARPEILYGGAPRALIEHVQRLVRSVTGVELPSSKDWGDGDDDVWIRLPHAVSSALLAEEDAPLDLSGWLGAEGAAGRAFVEVDGDAVRVGPVTLRRRVGADARAPGPELFAHYCLDERTAETLLHVAEGVRLREPVLLEGETSVSKTSIVQYLAMLLRQPLVRINLNGQTDTGELVGRYVPQDAAAALPVAPEELLASKELLRPESRSILERAVGEGRALHRVEVQQVMAHERMTVHPWRWQDGLVVTAMKRGWWVVLDELNLAEPQILERLNPVLETVPSLVLTEHDHAVIGPGGHPVHPDFRLFATMNPAEYAGRSALSPAYRDRWRGYRFVVPPGEAEYLAMLRYLVRGEQPSVQVGGQRWSGGTEEPPMGGLSEQAGIDDFLRALARFHAALEQAVGRGGSGRGQTLGVRRRERYVFSRRGLLSVMEYLDAMGTDGSVVAMRRALARYYLGRVTPGADQRVVAKLLDAAGIGPGVWAPERLDVLPSSPRARADAPDVRDEGSDDEDRVPEDLARFAEE